MEVVILIHLRGKLVHYNEIFIVEEKNVLSNVSIVSVVKVSTYVTTMSKR